MSNAKCSTCNHLLTKHAPSGGCRYCFCSAKGPKQAEPDQMYIEHWDQMVGKTVSKVTNRDDHIKIHFTDGTHAALHGWDDGSVFINERGLSDNELHREAIKNLSKKESKNENPNN
jgi:hypothetical protein